MDANGLIVEDGYVIVGRAGQRVPLPTVAEPGPGASRTGAVAAERRFERDGGSGALLAAGFVHLAAARRVSGGRLRTAEPSGAGSTRPAN